MPCGSIDVTKNRSVPPAQPVLGELALRHCFTTQKDRSHGDMVSATTDVDREPVVVEQKFE
jgi:hypothetical protein